MVNEQRGSIVFDPYVMGSCMIILDKDDAKKLRDLLTEWLG